MASPSPSKKFVIPKKKKLTAETSSSDASVKVEPREEPVYASPLKRGVKRELEDGSHRKPSTSKADTEEDYLKLMESKSGFSISRKEDLPKVKYYMISDLPIHKTYLALSWGQFHLRSKKNDFATTFSFIPLITLIFRENG